MDEQQIPAPYMFTAASSSSFDINFPGTPPTQLPDHLGLSSSSCSGVSLSENNITGPEDLSNVIGGGNKRRVCSRSRKSTSVPRFEFQTRSEEDILDDGFRWRKYGQKSVKNSNFPRSYYRCTHHTCEVKKQVQRLSKDTTIVVTTYEGIHNHPCEKLMETLTPLLQQIHLLTNMNSR